MTYWYSFYSLYNNEFGKNSLMTSATTRHVFLMKPTCIAIMELNYSRNYETYSVVGSVVCSFRAETVAGLQPYILGCLAHRKYAWAKTCRGWALRNDIDYSVILTCSEFLERCLHPFCLNEENNQNGRDKALILGLNSAVPRTVRHCGGWILPVPQVSLIHVFGVQ